MFLHALDKWFRLCMTPNESEEGVGVGVGVGRGDTTGNRSTSHYTKATNSAVSSPATSAVPPSSQNDNMFKDICESISCQSHIFTSLPWMQQLLFYTIQRMNPAGHREGFPAISAIVDEEGESIAQLHSILIRLTNRCSGNDVVSSIASVCNQLESQIEENARLRAELQSLKSTSDALPF